MLDFGDAGGVAALAAEARRRLDAARRAPRVDYAAVRAAEGARAAARLRPLRAASCAADSAARRRFDAFVEREALVAGRLRAVPRAARRARRAATGASGTRRCAIAHPAALAAARARLDAEVRYYQYLQWIADDQWQRAREACGAGRRVRRLSVHGQRRQRRRLGAAARVPISTRRSACRRTPFAAEGQDWGLPAYRWDVRRGRGLRVARARARRTPSSSTASGSITCRLLPDVHPRARRRATFFSPPTKPRRWRRARR